MVLLVVVFATIGLAQATKAPDLKAIKDSISDPSSTYYYPTLFARYQSMDSTLTAVDYHYLYYGYPEQVTYMPLVDNSASLELEVLMSKRSTLTSADYSRAITLCKAILEIEPFNLRDINALAYIYTLSQQPEQSERLMQRLSMIAQTIRATGDGLSEEDPWWVIYFDHAIDLLDIMGCRQQLPIIVSRTVEFIAVSNMPKKGQRGYYFNFSEIYARKPDYLENVKAPKRKMNIKPWQPTSPYKL